LPTGSGVRRGFAASFSSSVLRSVRPPSPGTCGAGRTPHRRPGGSCTTTHCVATIDTFSVPSATFWLLFVMLILAHDGRKIVRFDVTRHHITGWLSRQVTEAFPWDKALRSQLRVRDSSYGPVFSKQVDPMDITEVLTAPRSPGRIGGSKRKFRTNPDSKCRSGRLQVSLAIRHDWLSDRSILHERSQSIAGASRCDDSFRYTDRLAVFASVLGTIYPNEGQLMGNGMSCRNLQKNHRREFNYGFSRRYGDRRRFELRGAFRYVTRAFCFAVNPALHPSTSHCNIRDLYWGCKRSRTEWGPLHLSLEGADARAAKQGSI
jgi:hypothetical protein